MRPNCGPVCRGDLVEVATMSNWWDWALLALAVGLFGLLVWRRLNRRRRPPNTFRVIVGDDE